MSNKYKFRDQDKPYFVSFSVVYWLDVFTRDVCRDILLDSLRYCQQNKGLEVYARVVMTNHVHLIIGRRGDDEMQGIVRDLKKYTSVQLVRAITENPRESRREWLLWMMERAGKRNPNNQKYQFWQQDNHPIELGTSEIAEQKWSYLHEDPFRAGLVAGPGVFVWLIHPCKSEDLPHDRHKSRFAKTCASGNYKDQTVGFVYRFVAG